MFLTSQTGKRILIKIEVMKKEEIFEIWMARCEKLKKISRSKKYTFAQKIKARRLLNEMIHRVISLSMLNYKPFKFEEGARYVK